MVERPEKTVEIVVDGESHSAEITTYMEGNLAIQTYDSEGFPYCRVTTNPEHRLEDGLVALRDDYETVIGQTRDALVEAGVIELVQPRQQIRLGYTSATLYRVLVLD